MATLDSDRLEAVLADILMTIDAGLTPDVEDLVRRYPDLADEIRRFLETEELFKPGAEPRPIRRLPQAFGRFTLEKELGRGGMGVVYRAYDPQLDCHVALKMILSGRLASREDVERFTREAKAVARLSHPNIVTLHEVGDVDGQHYFTMRLLEGRSLQDRLDSYRDCPREVAKLVRTLATALRYSHQSMILHRDLKPGNVLFDVGGNPYVTDFGLAKRMDGANPETATGEVMATLGYAPPEIVFPNSGPLGWTVDVYGLGAILYAALTGHAPFEGENVAELLRRLKEDDPRSPRSLNPEVSVDLDAICLMALRRKPEQRYESAKALADDVESYLEGKPVKARPISRLARVDRWCRRRPAVVALGVMAILAGVLLFLWVEAVRLRGARQAARQEEILESNVFTARFASNVILHRMKEWGFRVETLSRSPELVALLSAWDRSLKERPYEAPEDVKLRPEAKKLEDFLNRIPNEPMVVNWQIMDTKGVIVARKPAWVIGVDFKERDYFRGTLRHGGREGLDSVHVSSVYRSQLDGLDKFDICAPVMDAGTPIGVVAVAITTDPTLGVPHIQSEQRKVVLIGPWDPSPPHKRPPTERPPEFVVLLHPAMTAGQEAVPFDKSKFPAGFPRTCDHELTSNDTRPASALKKRDYEDPFASRDANFGGRWLAGFAPVGSTGFVVIVQQLEE